MIDHCVTAGYKLIKRKVTALTSFNSKNLFFVENEVILCMNIISK